MKLSFIFELLLIFILVAFAASAAVDNKSIKSKKKVVSYRTKVTRPRQNQNVTQTVAQPQPPAQQSPPNRFCTCAKQMCNCCRDFNLKLLNLKGPGCAVLQYLQGDQLAISMSFNDRVLTNTTIKGKF
ncbi:unnamed protein product [Diabrotica balteata]|uniref:DUF4773 domain-containing protein n=1 Tax=Diabrotica balteata TaxID=107213 RepID=A0A9N9X7Z9_DIABA|nr:unnamed protein product [Diabrotica balteata]